MPIRTVTRSIDLTADVARTWEALATAEGLAAWLGSSVEVAGAGGLLPGSTAVLVEGDRRRRLVVSERTEGGSLAFTWWDEDRPDDPSTVRVELDATDEGVRVTVTETADVVAPLGGAGRASLSPAAVDHLADPGSAWDRRPARLAGMLLPVPAPA
ncbi:MAG: SRPBCC domain-containing protein [Actinobacteria bacterium]|nr:SRPBCC domain-containing protein [Actinomycetota bacterium]